MVVAGLLAACLTGCGGGPAPGPKHTGGRQEPASPAEQQILDRLDDWTGDQTIAGVTVQAEPPYFAASGATCRRLVLGGKERRLACDNDPGSPGGWYYAPDVLVAPAAVP